MKLRPCLDISLVGKPSGVVEVLTEPEVLYLPLRSQRFSFSQTSVTEGQRILPGQILATDPDNYGVPLIAPRAGTVRLEAVENHIVLEDVANEPEQKYDDPNGGAHAAKDGESLEEKRQKLLSLGAWQFLYDAHDESLPDPAGTPRAVIVSTLHLEPFSSRGDTQMVKRLSSFTRGLEHIQSLLEYQPIYLVMPDTQSQLAGKVRDAIRGYAWVKVVEVPLQYPRDNFTVLARSLGLQAERGEPVWAVRAEGVLAIDRAMTLGQPCTVRIVSLAGPAVTSPVHLRAMPGYPLNKIIPSRVHEGATRVINGGVLTGETIDPAQQGLDAECMALTVLDEQVDREMLGFVRPGGDRRSYSRCFTSSLRGRFGESLTTGLRGERRPCIACGFCEEVCPAKIMPHMIHRRLYQGDIEDALQIRVDLCVRCGMCSLVCPSKLDLRGQFIEAQNTIRQELHVEEVQA